MRHHKWILIGALALGTPAVLPLGAFGAERPRLEVVNWDEVPRPARQALRNAQNGRLIKLVRIDYGGHTSYRASYDERGQVHVIRVNEDGRVISDKDKDQYGRLDDFNVDREKYTEVRISDLPDPVRQTLRRELPRRNVDQVTEVRRGDFTYYLVDTDNGREIRIDRFGDVLSQNDPMLLSNVENHKSRYWEERAIDRDWDQFASGRPMRYDDLPGEVKNAIGGQMHQGDHATDVVHLRNGEYLVTVEAGNGRFSRMYRVSSSGRIESTRNATEEGATVVRYNDLPGPVKDAVAHDARPGEVHRILQITRDGHTWFNIMVNDGDHMKLLRVDMQGHRLD